MVVGGVVYGCGLIVLAIAGAPEVRRLRAVAVPWSGSDRPGNRAFLLAGLFITAFGGARLAQHIGEWLALPAIALMCAIACGPTLVYKLRTRRP